MRMAPNNFVVNNAYAAIGSRTAVAIDAAYISQVSGDAIGYRYSSISTDPIEEFYVFVSSFTGTKANATMQCTIYNENTTVVTRAGATVRATATSTAYPAGAAGWVKFTFGTPYTPAQGEVIWFVVTNTAILPAVDFPNVLNATAFNLPAFNWMLPCTSSAGFSAAGTAVPKAPFMLKQGAVYRGNPYTVASTPTTTTVKRGIIVTPEVDTTLGSYEGLSINSATNITIHESTQLPNDTPVYTYALGGANKVSDRLNSSVALTPFVLRKGKTYYVCVATSANSTSPTDVAIEDYSSYPAMFDAFVDGTNVCGKVLDNGANAWVINNRLTQRIGLQVQLLSNPTITSAS